MPRREKEKVLVVGLRRAGMTRDYAEASLKELMALVDTAGGEVVTEVWQEIRRPNPATLIGEGKAVEIKGIVAAENIDTVIFDDELTPAQNRNLSDLFEAKVLDRTALILDIFAARAATKEGKLQVELAQTRYWATRLTGRGLSLSQQAGHIGNRGPGETKLEMDRRRVKEKITQLQTELRKVRAHRAIHRRKRAGVAVPTISLIGYTNAGKSTLLNSLTGSNVLVEDKLFATLDPTVRRLRLKSGREILVADTVGFIRRLPHQLVEAFKATFEEVERSDLLLHIVDVSSEDAPAQFKTVETLIRELGLQNKPLLTVYNKSDRPNRHLVPNSSIIEISALKRSGIETLLEKVDAILRQSFHEVTLKIPYQSAGILDDIYKHGRVLHIRRLPDGIVVKALLSEKQSGRYKGLKV